MYCFKDLYSHSHLHSHFFIKFVFCTQKRAKVVIFFGLCKYFCDFCGKTHFFAYISKKSNVVMSYLGKASNDYCKQFSARPLFTILGGSRSFRKRKDAPPTEFTFAESCEQQLFAQKIYNMQAYLSFSLKNLHIRFFCSNFAR